MPFWTPPRTPLELIPFTIKLWAATHLVMTYVGHTNGTYGPSMLPTMNVRGDRILVSTLHRRGRGIQAGDVITFKHPVVPAEGACKRVIGMPGDWVVVDGCESDGRMIQVPKGHCWVEGDHSIWSRDSRVYGPLPLALIKGKVIGRTAPWSQRNWSRNPFND